MRATVYLGPHSLEVVERPDPVIDAPTDAVVRVSLGCVCGSDLWYFRGESPHAFGPIGHEFIGVVEEIGAEVRGLAKGDLVVAPFTFSDGTCPHCRAGVTSKCVSGVRSAIMGLTEAKARPCAFLWLPAPSFEFPRLSIPMPPCDPWRHSPM